MVGFADTCVSTVRARGGDLDDCISPFLLSQAKLAAISRKTEHETLQQQGDVPKCLVNRWVSAKEGCGRISMLRRGSANFHVIPQAS